MKLKVIFILYSLPRGGKERRFLELINYLKSKTEVHFSILILTENIEYDELLQYDNLNAITVKGRLKHLHWLTKLYRECREFKPDIIHSWGKTPGVYSGILSVLLNVPAVASFINDVPPRRPNIYWRIITGFLTLTNSKVLSNTKRGLDLFNIPESKGLCIYNGFTLNRLERRVSDEVVRKRYSLSAKYVIGMIGALEPRKDFTSYLKVAHRICSKRTDTVFLVIGGGADEENLKKMISPDFINRIVFTGRLNNVEDLIQVLDIGILLTNVNVHGEGISNTIIEYMAFSKPVIATDSGGSPEILSHGETGYLIKMNNVDDICEKIDFLLENPEEREKQGKKGSQVIKERFTADRMGNEFLNLYKQLGK